MLKDTYPLLDARAAWKRETEVISPVGRIRVKGNLHNRGECAAACSSTDNTFTKDDSCAAPCEDDPVVSNVRAALHAALGSDVHDVATYFGSPAGAPTFELEVDVPPGKELIAVKALSDVPSLVTGILLP